MKITIVGVAILNFLAGIVWLDNHLPGPPPIDAATKARFDIYETNQK